MSIQRALLLFASLLLLHHPLLSQETEDTLSHCFSRSELLQIVHMPVSDPNSTELLDLLDAKGYQCGLDVLQRSDTVESIVMEYKCQVYYDKVDGRLLPVVFVYESRDSLPNIVVLRILNNDSCALQLSSDLLEAGYLYDGQSHIYSGRDGSGKQNGIYEAAYSDGSGVIVTFREQSAINNYVRKQIEQRTYRVGSLKKSAIHHARNNSFYKAYTCLDSAIGIYPPLDEELVGIRAQILDEHKGYFFVRLKESVNQRGNYADGIAWSDSLLTLLPANDSILQIRRVLEDQMVGKSQKYSSFNPEAYNQIVQLVDSIVNLEIRSHHEYKHQTLDLAFTFATTTENNSFGSVQLNTYRSFIQSKSKERQRIQYLQLLIDSIASSDIIQPIYNYEIAINTNEVLNAKIDWFYKELELDERMKLSDEEQSFMDSIEKHFFYIPDPARPGQTLKRVPYHRECVFGITTKLYNGNTYTDVSLIDFTTSDIFSWAPSLIIPGLGTASQGYRSSVSSRAIPFFLFGGLAIAGYFLENNGKQKIPWDESGPVWEHVNFGKGLMIGGGFIAVSIYITDLVQSVVATVQNIKRSKMLRKTMRTDGEVILKLEDVQLK